MISIKRNRDQWELFQSATEKDVETLNQAANKAVLSGLKYG